MLTENSILNIYYGFMFKDEFPLRKKTLWKSRSLTVILNLYVGSRTMHIQLNLKKLEK